MFRSRLLEEDGERELNSSSKFERLDSFLRLIDTSSQEVTFLRGEDLNSSSKSRSRPGERELNLEPMRLSSSGNKSRSISPSSLVFDNHLLHGNTYLFPVEMTFISTRSTNQSFEKNCKFYLL